MRRQGIRSFLAWLALPCAAMAAPSSIDPAAQRIVDRTRTVTTSYSAFNWNIVVLPEGETGEEWSAEFHQGDLHRVETPRDRIVANCRTRSGTYLNLVTGERLEGAKVAGAACGIQSNIPPQNVALLPSRKSGNGWIDRVKIVDSEAVRTYDVNSLGVIVAATISDHAGMPQLTAWTRALRRKAPAEAFTAESLNRSFVTATYRTRPTSKLRF